MEEENRMCEGTTAVLLSFCLCTDSLSLLCLEVAQLLRVNSKLAICSKQNNTENLFKILENFMEF